MQRDGGGDVQKPVLAGAHPRVPARAATGAAPEERIAAASALGYAETRDSTRVLATLTRDATDDVALQAIRELRWGGAVAVDALVGVLSDANRSEGIRAAAAGQLAYLEANLSPQLAALRDQLAAN